jgi:hypothetical protein
LSGRPNLEDTIERSQRVMSKVAAELAIMLVRRKMSKSRLREAVLLLEGVCNDIRSLLPDEKNDGSKPDR